MGKIASKKVNNINDLKKDIQKTPKKSPFLVSWDSYRHEKRPFSLELSTT